MANELLATSADQLLIIFASSVGIFVTVITYTKIAGLRSFSKMSSFDFAMTVAVGSMIATVALAQVSLIEGMVALAALYVTQIFIALLRRFRLFKQAVDNTPLLLVANGKMLTENMKTARITEEDLKSKLREANIIRLSSVRAVVFETTGNVSILSGDGDLDMQLLSGVRDKDKLTES